MEAVSTLSKSVMIVEDESIISLDIKNSLTKLGYKISGVAASGEAALRKIERTKPDVILMDIHLKGEMTGIEVSKEVMSAFCIPIVYLTANADSSTFKEAQNTNPFGFVLKPFEEKALGNAIEIALNKHSKEQTVRSSETWYATAFQSIKAAIIATDPHGQVVFMNAAAEDITGWKLAEVIERPVVEVLCFHRKIQQFDKIVPRQSVNAILGTVLREKREVLLPENTQIETRSAKCISIEGKATVLESSSGSIIGSLFMFEATRSSRSQSYQPQSSLPQSQNGALSTSSKNGLEDALLAPNELSQQHKPKDGQAEIERLDKPDIDLVKAFTQHIANRQPFSAATFNLIATAEVDWAKLVSATDGVVVKAALSKSNRLTAILKEQSAYEKLVCHFLVENSFFPVSKRSDGSYHYQYCEIPENCQVYRTEGVTLWKAWHGKTIPSQLAIAQKLRSLSRKDIVVFRRGRWCGIQKLAFEKENLHVKTLHGEIYVEQGDVLIWGVKQ